LKDGWAPVDTSLVATNLYSSSGKLRQDGDCLWLGWVEPEIWSLGLNGPGLTDSKNLVAQYTP
jgi:hypothetical protein